MPVDPRTGLFSYGEPSFQPGGSSPALGGLVSLMNALQGQQNRQKALASQTQAEAENVFKMGSQGMPQTPELSQAASTLGISPSSSASIAGAGEIPQIRQGLQEWMTENPGKRPSPEDLNTIYLKASGKGMPGYNVYASRIAETERKTNAGEQALVDKVYIQALKNESGMDRQGRSPQDMREATVAAVMDAPSVQRMPEEARRQLENRLRNAPLLSEVSPEAKSKEAQRAAVGKAAIARANYLDKIGGPMAQSLLTKVGLDEQRAMNLAKVAENMGTLTEPQKAARLTDVKKLQEKELNQTVPQQEKAKHDAYMATLAELEKRFQPSATGGNAKTKYTPGLTYRNKNTGKTAVADANGNLVEQ